MSSRFSPILLSLIIGILLSACGPSQAQLDAAATQVAANIFATQTAQAPTITPTFTPSPTATETPTSTPTLAPTNTPTLTPAPTRTRTPTLKPTPTPRLMALALTPNDLPAGFVTMPLDQARDWQQSWPEDTYGFVMGDEKRSQVVIGFLIPFPGRADQLRFDASLPQFVEFSAALVGGTDHKKLDGLDDIGDARAAITSIGRLSSISYRWDTIGFRRGEVAVILIVAYPDGDQPAVPLGDLARLQEARISQAHTLRAVSLGRK